MHMIRGVIDNVIFDFLDSQNSEVLAISGKWGVGKTYALQSMIDSYTGTGSLGWYSYVSAFGAKSIGELRTMILVKSRRFPVKHDKLEKAVESAETFFAKGRGLAIWKAITASADKIPIVGKQVTVLLETVATSLISKTIVCIDDIERLGSGIEMDDLLGLVSELKVESQCKIILLFNEEQLGERAKQYERASEKVIDKKLEFVTTAAEAIEIGLPADTPMREYVVPCIETLDINNIRTIQKIAHGLTTVDGLIPDCSEDVKKQGAVAVAVFAGALYESGQGFPKPEHIISYNWFSAAMREGSDALDEAWREKLHACGFLHSDEFDTEVLSILKNGYAHGSELVKHAQALDEVVGRGQLDAVFTAAWNTFHDRIDGSAEQLVQQFVKAVEVAATVITPLNLNSTVRLLRELDFSAEADALIDRYVQLNAGRTGLFRIDDSPWSKDINDETLRKRFAEIVTEDEGPLELDAAATILLEEGPWDGRLQAALLMASPNDFVNLFKEYQGDGLRPLLDHLYRAAHKRGQETEPIAVAVSAALDQISAESKLNEIRIGRLRR
jgi:hypothetical protein